MFAGRNPTDRKMSYTHTQSPAFSGAQWEGRLKPLKSWSQILLWGLVILMFVAAAAALA